MTRLAIIDPEKCKPKKCRLECKSKCPINQNGKICIEVSKEAKSASIAESLCIGCSMCVRVCPFGAIKIINTPQELKVDPVFRYGTNGFQLYNLPLPQKGMVVGIMGVNGIGKSTILKILSRNIPLESNINNRFNGTELQPFLDPESKLTFAYKPQYIEKIAKIKNIKVMDLLQKKNHREMLDESIRVLELEGILNREVSVLSGGELQRLAIALVYLQDVDVYFFDEPTSYLDVEQRLKVSNLIRELASLGKYVIVVEHDISILDYLTDSVCLLFGEPGAYGVVSNPISTKKSINQYLDGYIKDMNIRFRDYSLDFKKTMEEEIEIKKELDYPGMKIKVGDFKLEIEGGNISSGEINVIVGRNGTGKTTFLRNIHGKFKNVSYKPQILTPKFEGTVQELIHSRIGQMPPVFVNGVIKGLGVDRCYSQLVKTLSGGETQAVAIVLCLGKPADVYMLDEPSAYLDCEQRIMASKIIKKFISDTGKMAFVVDHDFIMVSTIADKIIVAGGEPGIKGVIKYPLPKKTGLNMFLKNLNITFRYDKESGRSRINKLNSQQDQDQKKTGKYLSR